ncbi:ABC transporter related protein [Denitrovibrio acetiphilus DSM 12809]|uniref:ABC transporter related protein n=1 Tax=Denitrovibrio acetiphilus (strain DSM 12809 / NBRC 114555 / N2460) TaxID=522772 RepID=D4H279_DENA2|nr:sugar ABC transporter ATP-binding protein [Denitrovibrio acetiphilus]ADD68870.1 ABC transporter related protein [Denitrovibrio acetiphilus DSM 12809]
MKEKKPLVSLRNIGKSFGATRALDGVSFDFYPGEIFAMVGANGAGKSTLIKIICGYYPDYEGEITIAGENVKFSTPQDAYQKGIQTVHQIINQGVIPNMTVAENLALAHMLSPEQSFWYKPKEVSEVAREIADNMELDLDLNEEVENLSQSDRQLIAIARALAAKPKLLILDEPTSSISEKESERLFEMLLKLRDKGVSILYVSHRLHEIERIADRVGVIRDGKQGDLLIRPFNVKQIVTSMVGEIETHKRAAAETLADGEIKLEFRNLVVTENTPPINMKVMDGEILGITGLIGAGKSELAEVLFGIRKPISGQILIEGKEFEPKNIADAIKKGVHLVPEDRNNNAVIPENSISYNVTIPFLNMFSKLGIMHPGRENKITETMIKDIGIKCSSSDALIESLSGGNQQKVIVSRWLFKQSKVLILDEPFQGVDIRSRHDICKYLATSSGGRAVIVLAADLDEILEVADRIVVLNHGIIAGEQKYQDADRSTLLHWISRSPDEIHIGD